MARFRMTYAFHYGSVKVAAGKKLADNLANSQPGDAVWPGLTAATVPKGSIALDASATTMENTWPVDRQCPDRSINQRTMETGEGMAAAINGTTGMLGNGSA